MRRRAFVGMLGAAAPAVLAGAAPETPGAPAGDAASPRRPFPHAVRALVAADVRPGVVVLAWREPYQHDDVAAYVVYRDCEPLAELPADERTFSDETVLSGRTHTYTVRTRNAAGRQSVACGLYGYSGFHPSADGTGAHVELHYAPHLPFVTGACIAPFWKDIEHEEGVGDWRYLDDAFERCLAAPRKLVLWPFTASEKWLPEWLKTRVKVHDIPGVGRCLYPLDAELIAAWEGFVGRLAARYADHPALEHVLLACGGHYCLTPPGGVGDKGEEGLKWTRQNLGYTDEAHLEAWERAIDLYAQLFPDKALSYNVMFLNRTGDIAIEVAERALRKHGSRVRLQTENLNGNSWWRTQPYNWGFSRINHWIARQASRTSVGWQMHGPSWGGASGAEAMDKGMNGPLQAALDNGIAFEGSWVEVWKQDLSHGQYEPILRQAAARMGVLTVDVP